MSVRVAMIGLGFGAEFIPIYQRHPQAELAAICRRDPAGLDAVGDQYGIEQAATRTTGSCCATPTSTPSTSTRRSRTTPG